MADKIATPEDVEKFFDDLQARIFSAADERLYESGHQHTLTPEQAQAQRETIDAARALPWGATENSITREQARRNELQLHSANVVCESRDESKTGGESMTCAAWVMVLCIVALAVLVFWPR